MKRFLRPEQPDLAFHGSRYAEEEIVAVVRSA